MPRGIRFMKDAVVPVCLPKKDAKYNKGLKCTVAGFGSTSPRANRTPRYMQQAALPYIPWKTCRRPQVYGRDQLTNTMFCAGYLEGGT